MPRTRKRPTPPLVINYLGTNEKLSASERAILQHLLDATIRDRDYAMTTDALFDWGAGVRARLGRRITAQSAKKALDRLRAGGFIDGDWHYEITRYPAGGAMTHLTITDPVSLTEAALPRASVPEMNAAAHQAKQDAIRSARQQIMRSVRRERQLHSRILENLDLLEQEEQGMSDEQLLERLRSVGMTADAYRLAKLLDPYWVPVV